MKKQSLTAGKNPNELMSMLAEKREELRAMRFAAAGTRSTNGAPAKAVRKDIARIMTALTATAQ